MTEQKGFKAQETKEEKVDSGQQVKDLVSETQDSPSANTFKGSVDKQNGTAVVKDGYLEASSIFATGKSVSDVTQVQGPKSAELDAMIDHASTAGQEGWKDIVRAVIPIATHTIDGFVSGYGNRAHNQPDYMLAQAPLYQTWNQQQQQYQTLGQPQQQPWNQLPHPYQAMVQQHPYQSMAQAPLRHQQPYHPLAYQTPPLAQIQQPHQQPWNQPAQPYNTLAPMWNQQPQPYQTLVQPQQQLTPADKFDSQVNAIIAGETIAGLLNPLSLSGDVDIVQPILDRVGTSVDQLADNPAEQDKIKNTPLEPLFRRATALSIIDGVGDDPKALVALNSALGNKPLDAQQLAKIQRSPQAAREFLVDNLEAKLQGMSIQDLSRLAKAVEDDKANAAQNGQNPGNPGPALRRACQITDIANKLSKDTAGTAMAAASIGDIGEVFQVYGQSPDARKEWIIQHLKNSSDDNLNSLDKAAQQHN